MPIKDDKSNTFNIERLSLMQEYYSQEEFSLMSISPQEYWLVTLSSKKLSILNSFTLATKHTFSFDKEHDEYILIKWLPDSLLLVTTNNELVFLKKGGFLKKYKLPILHGRILSLEIYRPDYLIIVTNDGVIKFNYSKILCSFLYRCNNRIGGISTNGRAFYNDNGEVFLLKEQYIISVGRNINFKITHIDAIEEIIILGSSQGEVYLLKNFELEKIYSTSANILFVGFLTNQLVYIVLEEHHIIIFNLKENKKINITTGPPDKIAQVSAHPRDLCLFLRSDSHFIYKWKYEYPFLESTLIGNFRLIEDCGDCIDVDDDENFNWRLEKNEKMRRFDGVDLYSGIVNIGQSELWFL